jgi:lipopolysaccharide transport system ATP-binding protein
VVTKYLAAMAEKDARFLEHDLVNHPRQTSRSAAEIVENIPNIDHRFGDGRAEVLGIAIYGHDGERLDSLMPNSAVVVRISVRAKANLDRPIVGFMFRNHLGVDFAGTNTAREAYTLPPMAAGDTCTVDFYIELPTLYASSFSFSPAVADGTLEHYSICDWIDNAVALPMAPSDGPIYGQFHFPCRIEVNSKIGAGAAAL